MFYNTGNRFLLLTFPCTSRICRQVVIQIILIYIIAWIMSTLIIITANAQISIWMLENSLSSSPCLNTLKNSWKIEGTLEHWRSYILYHITSEKYSNTRATYKFIHNHIREIIKKTHQDFEDWSIPKISKTFQYFQVLHKPPRSLKIE